MEHIVNICLHLEDVEHIAVSLAFSQRARSTSPSSAWPTFAFSRHCQLLSAPGGRGVHCCQPGLQPGGTEHIAKFSLANFCLQPEDAEHVAKFSLAHFCLHPEDVELIDKFSLAHFCLQAEDVEHFATFSMAYFCLHQEDTEHIAVSLAHFSLQLEDMEHITNFSFATSVSIWRTWSILPTSDLQILSALGGHGAYCL